MSKIFSLGGRESSLFVISGLCISFVISTNNLTVLNLSLEIFMCQKLKTCGDLFV